MASNDGVQIRHAPHESQLTMSEITRRAPIIRLIRRCAAAALIASFAPFAAALERGVDRGVPYLSGGVTLEERDEIALLQVEYNVRIVTAARPSGAFLAQVHLDVHRGDQLVFDRTLDGPWLFLRLAPGTYTMTANADGVLRRQNVTVPTTGRVNVMFVWEDRETGTTDSAPRR